ncbi:TonB-dependent receptor [Ramlibacter sp. WS9]|uniref:TonB-dependent siderophore receptor n=1 Tax=Ramlibacter sp. WS9 TaxID=1882741 RepID=UPI0013051563|nr:TonB-dependent receptor [Ramlibacter sp. WS9]
MGIKSSLRVTALAAHLLFAFHAQAQSQVMDIPGGDLKAALDAYITQSGQKVQYSADDLKGRTSPGAKGRQAPEQMLKELLQGTNLAVHTDSSGQYTIRPIALLDQVVIRGSASHLADRNVSGTRAEVDPMSLPMTIETVGAKLLSEQSSQSLADAINYLPGVTGNAADHTFQIRGFSGSVMRNGVVSDAKFGPPVGTIQSIEVLKGPAAILNGVGVGYGGVINVIGKAPQAQTVREVSLQLGSHDRAELGLDLAGALDQDKRWKYRLIASEMTEGKNEEGVNGAYHHYIAPAVSYSNWDTGTEASLSLEYNQQRTTPFLGVFYGPNEKLGDKHGFTPTSNPDSGYHRKNTIVSAKVRQKISDDWDVSVNLSRERSLQDNSAPQITVGFVAPFDISTFTFPNLLKTELQENDTLIRSTLKVDLTGEVKTGPVSHKLLFAYDKTRGREVADRNYGSAVEGINVQTGAVASFPGVNPYTATIVYDRSDVQEGFLATDHIKWGSWVALAGVRHVKYKQAFAGQPGDSTTNEWLPSLGVLYEVTPDLSVYGSFNKGLTPYQGGGVMYGNGAPPPAEYAKQKELGFKALFADKQLALTAAVFDINQRNVNFLDVAHMNEGFFLTTIPGQKSRGFEVELSGNLSRHLNIRTSYSQTNLTLELDPALGAFLGLTDRNILSGFLPPKKKATFWGSYSFNGNGQDGWWAGAGAQWQSSIFVGSINWFGIPQTDYQKEVLPGKLRVDLAAGYRDKNRSLTLGIKNVTDAQQILNGSGGSARVDKGRSFYLSGQYNF